MFSARQKLILFGMSAKQVEHLSHSTQVSALISEEAPASDTILSRTVNAGEVDYGQRAVTQSLADRNSRETY